MFLILIKFHELCWYFYLQVRISDKRESPSHTRQVRSNQQVRPALLVRPDLQVRPALHPATI
jgi:hypothetical protein